MKRTAPEIRAFITENIVGRSSAELVEMVNARFGTSYTVKSLGSSLKNWGLRSGIGHGPPKGHRSSVFPEDVASFIEANYLGTSYTDMAAILNARFGTNYTRGQIKSFYGNHHLNSGLTGRFDKGHVPYNKGKTWDEYMSEEAKEKASKTQFKNGQLPPNTKPIGWERIDRDGYVEVKVRMRPSKSTCNDNFVLKHRLVWEQANGPIPEDCNVIFKDGNKLNCELSNLMLVTRAQHVVMNKCHLRSNVPEYAETSVLIADLKSAARKRKLARKEK